MAAPRKPKGYKKGSCVGVLICLFLDPLIRFGNVLKRASQSEESNFIGGGPNREGTPALPSAALSKAMPSSYTPVEPTALPTKPPDPSPENPQLIQVQLLVGANSLGNFVVCGTFEVLHGLQKSI